MTAIAEHSADNAERFQTEATQTRTQQFPRFTVRAAV